MFYVTLILSVITCACLALYWRQTKSRFAQLFNQFPMLPYKPIFGHILDFSSNPVKLYPQVRALISNFNETFGTWTVFLGAIHIIRADDAEIILSNMKYNTKGYIYSFFQPWLGDGLLLSDGEKWQHRRKLLTPTFHFNILRKFVEIFGEHSNKLVEKLKTECSNKEANIVPIVTHETLASICETAMGTKLDLKNKTHSSYLSAIYSVVPTMICRVFIPLFYTDEFFYISRTGFKQRGMLKTLHRFTTGIIKKREENFQESDLNLEETVDDLGIKKKRLAMLDLLISAKKNRGEIDFEGIREEVDTFMFEGHDTTAIGIVMALMLLAHHEDVQEKIFKELDAIFEGDERPASYDDLMKMKYLEMCIKESLRLYPSVPMIIRWTYEEVQLTKHLAPANLEVFIHIYEIHRDPKIYPDPEKYDPERFSPENCKGRHPYAYIPFSAGPRNCIGQKYALLEMKSIISAILRNFKLEPVTKFDELVWTIDLVLRVVGDVNVKFIPRK